MATKHITITIECLYPKDITIKFAPIKLWRSWIVILDYIGSKFFSMSRESHQSAKEVNKIQKKGKTAASIFLAIIEKVKRRENA